MFQLFSPQAKGPRGKKFPGYDKIFFTKGPESGSKCLPYGEGKAEFK
jgi:hypothetical protein